MFSSWAESGLTSALMAVGQIVAPFDGDIEPGQEGIDWETVPDDNSSGNDGNDGENINLDSILLDPPSLSDENNRGRGDEEIVELRSGLSASDDSFDGTQYLAERMTFDSPGRVRGWNQGGHGPGQGLDAIDHSRILDSIDNDENEDPDALDTAGPFSSPIQQGRIDKQTDRGRDFDSLSPIAAGTGTPIPDIQPSNNSSSSDSSSRAHNLSVSDQAMMLEQWREKSFYLERTITHLVEDQELLERKLTEKNKIILQLQSFETMTAQLQNEVRALRAQNEQQASALSEHRAITSVFSPPGKGANSSTQAVKAPSPPPEEEGQAAKMSELIFALTEYEHRVQGLQLEVKMLKEEKDKAKNSENNLSEEQTVTAAVDAATNALTQQLVAAQASIRRLEADATLVEQEHARQKEEEAAATSLTLEELQTLRREVQSTAQQNAQLQERNKQQSAELEAAIDEGVRMSQDWTDLTAQVQELQSSNMMLTQECEQLREQAQRQEGYQTVTQTRAMGESGSEKGNEHVQSSDPGESRRVLQLQAEVCELQQQALVQVQAQANLQSQYEREREQWSRVESTLQCEIGKLRQDIQGRTEEVEQLRASGVGAVEGSSQESQKLLDCQAANSQLISELAVRDAVAVELRGQVQVAKAKINSLEESSKQLNVIITQLRSTRRVNKDESDAVLAERNQFREQCDVLTAELRRVHAEKRAEDQAVESAYISSLQQTLRSSQDAQEQLIHSSSELQTQFDRLEKQHHDAQSALEALSSDYLVVKQDLSNREIELANMMSIVANVEADSKAAVTRLVKEHETRVAAIQASGATALEERSAEYVKQIEVNEREIKKLQDQLEIEVLLRRKSELEMRREKKRLEEGVETALRQLKNTNMEEVVDRTLIANLITTYVKQRRSLEVMKLLGNILHFSPEQEMVVGLRVPPPTLSLQSGMNSLFSAVSSLGSVATGAVGGARSSASGLPQPPMDLRGDNLGELLVSFLEAESGPTNRSDDSQSSSPNKQSLNDNNNNNNNNINTQA